MNRTLPDREQLHQGHRERLRARFIAEGLDNFVDHQVLELLLFAVMPRVDTNPIAHRLLQRFGTLSLVLEADTRDLATVEGMGPVAATFLSMIAPITRRYFQDRVHRELRPLDDVRAATAYLIPLMAGRSAEVFYVLCLDTRCRLIHPCLISEGTVNLAYVHPRLVVQAALRHNAVQVLLAHNHPGGTCTPSDADRRLTVALVQALGAIDITVVDHCIVAGEQVFSFANAGLMPTYRAPGN